MPLSPELRDHARKVRALLVDVDGTLTDGSVTVDADGREALTFNRRDGMGFDRWRAAGGIIVVVTQEDAPAVRHRMIKLSVECYMPGVQDKVAATDKICRQFSITPEQCAYVGDDVNDCAVIEYVGLGFAVADALPQVREVADVVLSRAGGRGAVREAVELLLEAQAPGG